MNAGVGTMTGSEADRSSRLGAAARVLGVVCLRTWKKTARRPVTLLFSLVQPLMWMLFFGFLFHRYPIADATRPGVSYTSFLLPGICAMTVLFGASQAGIPLLHDLQTRFLPRLLGTPASHGLVLAGKLGADVARLLAQAAVVLVIGLLVGARLAATPGAVAGGVLALALFAGAFASLSCLIALKTRAQESMAAFVHVVNMPLLFTSSALVPARQMPAWLQEAARWNPLTLAVNALRGALLDGVAPSPGGCLLPLGALALILFLLAARAMRGAAHDEEA